MIRLLTLLLLYQAGYIVGKYISIEIIIEKTKETYYETLRQSSVRWHEWQDDYKPFIRYYLGAALSAYKDFSEWGEYIFSRNMTAAQRMKEIVRNKVGKIAKKKIVSLCPV